MKQKRENRVLLLHWAGEQKSGCSGDFSIGGQRPLHYRPYIGIYRLMDATFNHVVPATGIGCRPWQ